MVDRSGKISDDTVGVSTESPATMRRAVKGVDADAFYGDGDANEVEAL